MGVLNKYHEKFSQPISKIWVRFTLLAFAGFVGWFLLKFYDDEIICFFGIPYGAKNYFALPILSFWILVALWLFRTYDTRQQIHQSNFVKGLENLVSNDPLRIDIGVILLLEVSKATPAFDKEIRLAFIKRLKELPKNLVGRKVIEIRDHKLSYAQYILQWLIEHQHENDKPLDLKGMDCRYQEFTVNRYTGKTNNKLKLSKILPAISRKPNWKDDLSNLDRVINPVITFTEANCENIDFNGVDLDAYNFSSATNVDMVGGYINIKLPRGMHEHQVSECVNQKTGQVVKNPVLNIPKPLTKEEVHAYEERKIYAPEMMADAIKQGFDLHQRNVP